MAWPCKVLGRCPLHSMSVLHVQYLLKLNHILFCRQIMLECDLVFIPNLRMGIRDLRSDREEVEVVRPMITRQTAGQYSGIFIPRYADLPPASDSES
jgi:hypothetical protein